MQEKNFLGKTGDISSPFTITSPDCFIAVYGEIGNGEVRLEVEMPISENTTDFVPFENLTFKETSYERLGVQMNKRYRVVFENCVNASVSITSAI